MKRSLESELLYAIDCAEEDHRAVVRKWRWVTCSMPLGAMVFVIGCAMGVFGHGEMCAALIASSLVLTAMCFTWFINTAPRHKGNYSSQRTIIHPTETKKAVAKAKHALLQHTILDQHGAQ